MEFKDTANIVKVSTWDSGGGALIDIVELADGRVIGITEDAIVLYANIDDLTEGDQAAERPHIYL
jgi:hypothetical protein